MSKLLSWAVGFGAAVLLVAGILAILYYVYKPEPLAPQTYTVYPIEPDKPIKTMGKKIATKATNTLAMPEFKAEKVEEKMTVKVAKKPVVNDPFTAEFEARLSEFERKIP